MSVPTPEEVMRIMAASPERTWHCAEPGCTASGNDEYGPYVYCVEHGKLEHTGPPPTRRGEAASSED